MPESVAAMVPGLLPLTASSWVQPGGRHAAPRSALTGRTSSLTTAPLTLSFVVGALLPTVSSKMPRGVESTVPAAPLAALSPALVEGATLRIQSR